MRTLAPFFIGKIKIDPPFFLAPLAGLTDRAFREMTAKRGASGLFVTEMVSAEGLLRNPERSAHYTAYTERQRPISCQIAGCDPARMAEAALAVEAMGMDAVDVNVGCPVPKVVKGGGGSSLLREPDSIFAIVRAMVKAVQIPVTVKIRTGWDASSINALDVAQGAAEAGAAAVAVHGRTRAQAYAGHSDWELIARVAAHVKIPVIGNGDVTTPETLVRRYEESGCAGVMVGRGAVMNPWIFGQARSLYETGRYETPSMEEKGRFLLEHFDEMLLDAPPVLACKKFRAYVPYYTNGVTNGKSLRAAVNSLEDPSEIKRMIEQFFFAAQEKADARLLAGGDAAA